MELPAHLRIAREYAEAQMRSTCTITRAGESEKVWNPATGTYTSPPAVTVYTGRCKVQDTGRSVSEEEAGERRAAITDQELHLPIDGSEGVRRKDDVVIDSNPDDAALVGRRFVVAGPHAATSKTARRLPIEGVL